MVDGYRVMARIADGRPVLFTRGDNDWSARMPGLVAQLAALGLQSAWLDGEIVVMGEEGVPRFNALQEAFDSHRTEAIQYFLFDAPFLDGQDLRQRPARGSRPCSMPPQARTRPGGRRGHRRVRRHASAADTPAQDRNQGFAFRGGPDR